MKSIYLIVGPLIQCVKTHQFHNLVILRSFILSLSLVTSVASSVIYVNQEATVGGDGQSWGSAFDNIQDALEVSVSGMDIWIAQGVYYPDEGNLQVNDDIFASFILVDGVSLYGGFNATETILEQRKTDINITILSGDISQDDINTDNNFIGESTDDIVNDNSYHIITGSNVDNNTILDGFTVTAGFANGGLNTEYSRGAGLYCGIRNSGPDLNQNTFIGNMAKSNGSATNGCFQHVKNSYYLNNYSGNNGGAFHTEGGSFENTVFEGNIAHRNGGALYNFNRPITIKNSEFINNSLETNIGGGVFSSGDTSLDNVLFKGNKARLGGGFYIQESTSSVVFTNVTFTGNSAVEEGGAIHIKEELINITINNSIIWNNEDNSGIGTADSSVFGIGIFNNSYSLIQGFGTTGTGNLDEDPLFVTDTDPTMAPTSAGNSRLMPVSIAIDAGDDTVVTTLYDLDGEDRIQNASVDMGAYEYTDLIFANGFE